MSIIDNNFHMHLAERSIRIVKEWCYCTTQSLLFSYFSKLLIVPIMCDTISNLSIFLKLNSICNNISLSTFVTRVPYLDYNYFQLSIRNYTEVYEDNDYQTNTVYTKGTQAITLNFIKNSMRSYYFLSIITGKRLNRG